MYDPGTRTACFETAIFVATVFIILLPTLWCLLDHPVFLACTVSSVVGIALSGICCDWEIDPGSP